MLIQNDGVNDGEKIIEQQSSLTNKHPDDLESNRNYHKHHSNNHRNGITTHLLCSFVWWTALSLISSLLITVGFWLPYWIQGFWMNDNDQNDLIKITFSPFRRCNFPLLDPNNEDNVHIMYKCIRYEQFDDIPTLSWKLTTILVGLGVLFSILVSLILLFACCMPNALTSSNTCLLVIAQILIILIIIAGCIIYPLGWNEQQQQLQQHQNICGNYNLEKPFELEKCHPSLSIYLIAFGLILLIICLMFGLCTSRQYRKFY
ncbi:hypothetical protein DERP_010838 [Dermatophagoides pteronyssinus]|uniref:LHFPL tetraspan subfamily member 6 protein-like n=2 Tax=Dermatophagoides pteronyssinus TaxID=6956 RepID=A0A6P6YF85_DERPT|nr:LHFPL tetraspan subfamily member 6 protein-like [Dermatophagoides pteronyssinus]KAH9426272.1 hypothetical protein DERP_010838 [Dermatophagoides pteronyssinus]